MKRNSYVMRRFIIIVSVVRAGVGQSVWTLVNTLDYQKIGFQLQRSIYFFICHVQTLAVSSVLGLGEVQWKDQGEIRSGDYTVYYSGDERAERDLRIVVPKGTVRSV
jgi:hypothetical protein